MDGRSTLVLYFSRTGNTLRAAKSVASRLGADVRRIKAREERPLWALALRSLFGAEESHRSLGVDLARYDLVLVASPIWMGKAVPTVRSVMDELPQGTRYALILTSAAGTPQRGLASLRNGVRRDPVALLHISDADRKEGREVALIDAFVAELAHSRSATRPHQAPPDATNT